MKKNYYFPILLFFFIGYATTPLRSQHVQYLLPEGLAEHEWLENMVEFHSPAGPTFDHFDASEYLLDSVYFYQRNTATDQWDTQGKQIYQYDATGTEIDRINYQWVDLWQKGNRIIPTYDANGRIEEMIFFNWDVVFNDWFPSARFTMAYEDHTDPSELIFYQWDVGIQPWLPSIKSTLEYDDAGNAIEVINFNWDSANNVWIPGNRAQTAYNGIVERIFFEFNPQDTTWKPLNLTTTEYNIDSSEVLYTYYNIDTISGGWTPNSRLRYVYEDVTSMLESETIYQWNVLTMLWETSQKNDYTYDSNENLTQIISSQWNNEAWVLQVRNDYYWSEHEIVTGVAETTLPEWNIYPNPASQFLFLSGFESAVSIEILSEHGQMVRKDFNVSTGEGVRVHDLPAGTYIVKMTSDGQTAVRKFIKL